MPPKIPPQARRHDVDAPVHQHDRAALGRREAVEPVGDARVALEKPADHAVGRRISSGRARPRAPGSGTPACRGCRCSGRARGSSRLSRCRGSGAGWRSRRRGWCAGGTDCGSAARSASPRTASPACSRARPARDTAYLRKPLSTSITPEHQLRIEPRARRLVVHRAQKLEALLRSGMRCARRWSISSSQRWPSWARAEVQRRRRAVGDHARQRAGARCRRAARRSGLRPARERSKRASSAASGEHEPPHARRSCRKATTLLERHVAAACRRAGPCTRRCRRRGRARRAPRGAGCRSAPCRRTARRGARRGRPSARRCRRPQLAVQPLGGLAHRRALVVADRHQAGLERRHRRGKTMPRSSWFCSIAAATMRVTPMP